MSRAGRVAAVAHTRPAPSSLDGPIHGDATWYLPDLHVFVRRERRVVDPGDRVLGDPRADAHEGAEVHDRGEHHAIDRQLLDPVERRLALAHVALAGLLLEQIVDVRIPTVGICTLRVDELLHAAGRVSRVPHAGDEQAAELLLAPGG